MSVKKITDRIEKHGWIQGQAGNERIGYCLVGANSAITDWSDISSPGVLGRIEDTIRELFPERLRDGIADSKLRPAARFNDHPSTTLEDVMLVLKHARGEGK